MDKKSINMLSNSQPVKEERLINYIIKIVGNYYDMDDNYCYTKYRKREIVFSRQVAMYLIMKYSKKITLEKIGSKFGNKNHATVLHAKKIVQGMIDTYANVKKQIEEIENIVKLNYIAIDKSVRLNNDFYFIDFNDHHSIKINNNKGIILSGFTEEELLRIIKIIENITDQRDHKNTGLYILEKK
jgi:hypothetical protein